MTQCTWQDYTVTVRWPPRCLFVWVALQLTRIPLPGAVQCCLPLLFNTLQFVWRHKEKHLATATGGQTVPPANWVSQKCHSNGRNFWNTFLWRTKEIKKNQQNKSWSVVKKCDKTSEPPVFFRVQPVSYRCEYKWRLITAAVFNRLSIQRKLPNSRLVWQCFVRQKYKKRRIFSSFPPICWVTPPPSGP